MTSAVILVEQGFQDEEVIYPYYRMQEEGWIVDVASPSLITQYCGKYGVPARTNRVIEHIHPDHYDVVIVPGGYECPDKLRMNTHALKFVREMCECRKIVAAICHGPWVLISAGIMRDVKATCYASVKDDLCNAGAIYLGGPVVRHVNIITSDHYKHNGDFMREIIEYNNHDE